MKAGQGSLAGSYVSVKAGEAYLLNAQISPYKPAADLQIDPMRTRKLLLHKTELEHLMGQLKSGLVAVPLAISLEKNLVKVEVGLGRGKKRQDKRELIKKRDQEREIRRQAKS